MRKARINNLVDQLETNNLDAIIISSPQNRTYLSGFSGSSGYLLISRDKRLLATDFRYFEHVEKEVSEFTLFKIHGKIEEWFGEFVGLIKPEKLGFESEHISIADHNSLNNSLKKFNLKTRLVATKGVVETLRMVKDKKELDFIKRAVAISQDAIDSVCESIGQGISEIELAWEMEKHMREHGSQALAFDVICASGPNSALPHARPSGRLIRLGEPVILDFGARVCGYTSDITRTICLGRPDSRFEKLYNILVDARNAAQESIVAGMKGCQADQSARRVIEKAGYGRYFGHGLGHGVGLEVHEGPSLSPLSSDYLKDGMVFTIEPGIYLPGWGGLRIEDDYLMVNGRLEVLSNKINQ